MSRSKTGKSSHRTPSSETLQENDGTPGKHRKGRRQHAKRGERKDGGTRNRVTIYGLHAVEAALQNPARKILQIMVTENAARTLAAAIGKSGLKPGITSGHDLSRQLGNDAVHQGAAVKARPLADDGLDILSPTNERPAPCVLILDQVTDPHNVGAIIRSAAVFGAAGLVMTRRHSAPLDGVTAKAASGGLEHLPIVCVNNLAQGMRDLVRNGFRIVGLDGDGTEILSKARISGPTALVLGAEGTGLRRLTRETCDEICRLPASGPLTSLNVSNAAAVALALTMPIT